MIKEIAKIYKIIFKGCFNCTCTVAFIVVSLMPIHLYPTLCKYFNNRFIPVLCIMLFYLFYFATLQGVYNYVKIKEIMNKHHMSYEKASEYFHSLDIYGGNDPIQPED